jgi:hypothetical protein
VGVAVGVVVGVDEPGKMEFELPLLEPPPPHAASAATISSAMKFRSVLRKSPLHYGSREKPKGERLAPVVRVEAPSYSFSAATTGG